MPSVDNRVVEMRFDNKDFETDVSESISSLDKLKQALNFKNVADDMDEIGKQTDTMSVKFSVLASFTDQWIRNLTNQIYHLKDQFVGLVKSLSTDQIAAGWDKYAVKTASVQTIMAATANQIEDEGERMKYVSEQLDQLNWFADETSASLMDMTSNIGKFTNNGIALKDAVTSMQGIANWGYLSGANIEQMSRAMYNLSQALSVGAVTLIDWKSIENANMATVEFKQTAIDTAVALGTLTKVSDGLYKTLEDNEVTLESFNQYLTKDRWFNKEVLSQVLDKYGAFTNELAAEMDKIEAAGAELSTSKFLGYIDDYLKNQLDLEEAVAKTGLSADELISDLKRLGSTEYALGRKAFKAAQEAKTFTEALEATKDAVSSKWMQTFEIIFGDYTHAKDLWTRLSNELWEIFAAGGDARNEMLKEWASDESGGYKVFWDAVWNIWDGLRGLGGKIKSAWKEIFPGLDTNKLIDFTKRFFEFSEKFKSKFVEVSDAILNVSDSIGEGINTFKETIGFIDDSSETSSAIDTLESTVGKIDKVVLALARTLRDLDILESGIWSGKYGTNPERKQMLDDLGYSYELLQNKVNETSDVLFRYAINEEKLAEAERLYNEGLIDQYENQEKALTVTKEANEEVQKARTWIDDLRDVLGGLKSAIDLVIEAAKLAARYLVVPTWQFLVNAFKKVLSIIAPFSKAFSNFVSKIKETKPITNTLKILAEYLRMIKENLQGHENFQKFSGYIEELKQKLSSFKEGRVNSFTSFLDKIAHLDQNLKLPKVSTVADWIDGILGYFNKFIDGMDDVVGFWPKIKEFINNLDFSDVKRFGSSAGTGVSEFLKGIFKDNDLKEVGKEWFNGVWEGLIEKIKTVDWSKLFGDIFKYLSSAVLIRLGWNIASFFNSFRDVGNGTIRLLESFGEVLRGFTTTLKATAFLEVAIGIGILAAAMYALSNVNKENLAQVAVDMATVILAMSVLVKVLGGVSKIFGGNRLKETIKNVGKFNIYFPRLGVALIGLALTIGAVVLAITALKKVSSDKMWEIGGFLAALLTWFAIIFGVLSQKSFNFNGRRMMAVAASFLILAVSLDLMLPAIGALVAMFAVYDLTHNTKIVWYAIGAIAAIMIAFGVLAKLSDKTTHALSVAALFVVISLAMSLMIQGFISLSKSVEDKPWWNLIIVVGSIAALLLSMALIFKNLNNIGKKSGSIINGTVALLAIATSIVLVGFILSKLRGLKWDEIKDSFWAIIGILGGFFVILATLSGLATITGVGEAVVITFIALASGLTLMGLAVNLTASGLLKFAEALKIVSDESLDAKKAGSNLAESIVSFFTVLNEKSDQIIEFVHKLMMSIIGAIVFYKNDFETVGAAIVDLLFGPMAKMLGSILIDVFEFLGNNIGNIIKTIYLLLTKIVNGLADAILTSGGLYLKAIFNLARAIAYLFTDALVEAFNESLGDTFIGKIIKFPGNLLDAALEKAFGVNLTDLVNDIFGNTKEERQERRRKELFDDVQQTSDDANAILNGVWDDFRKQIDSSSSLSSEIKTYEDPYSALINKILTADNKLDYNGAKLRGKKLQDLKESLLTNNITQDDLLRMFPEYFENVQKAANNFSLTDIINGELSIGTWLSNLFTSSNSSTTLFGAGEDSAINYAAGFDEGLNNKRDDFLDSIYDFNAAGINVGKETWKEGSPSKVTEELGMFVAQGFIVGIKKETFNTIQTLKSVYESIYSVIDRFSINLRDKLTASFNSVINRQKITDEIRIIINDLSSVINSEFELNPVIRPVLDLSEIQNGQIRLASMLGTGSYYFNPNLSYGMAGASNAIAASSNLTLRNASVDDSLLELRKDMLQVNSDNKTIISIMSRYMPYIPELRNMQVTLDKKTLVGELTPAIDAKLGNIAIRRR